MYLVVALVVGNPLGVLLVEIKAVLHQELHRLGFHDVILRAEERQVVDLAEIRVLGLQRESGQSNTGMDACYGELPKKPRGKPTEHG